MKEASLPLWQIALRLLVICVLCALLLTGVHALTAPRIQAGTQAKILAGVQSLFPASDLAEEMEVPTSVSVTGMYRAVSQETVLGYCVLVTGSGYGSDLQLMVGYDPQGELSGIRVISHNETKGIGDKALTEGYLSQYQGATGELTLGTEIDGVGGATLTSQGVLDCVNAANQAMAEVLE